MIKISRIQTRPNVSVPFFRAEQPKEKSMNLKEKYIKPGALVKIENLMSTDELQFESIFYWRSIEDYCNYLIDEDCHEVKADTSDLEKIKELNLTIKLIVKVIND